MAQVEKTFRFEADANRAADRAAASKLMTPEQRAANWAARLAAASSRDFINGKVF